MTQTEALRATADIKEIAGVRADQKWSSRYLYGWISDIPPARPLYVGGAGESWQAALDDLKRTIKERKP